MEKYHFPAQHGSGALSSVLEVQLPGRDPGPCRRDQERRDGMGADAGEETVSGKKKRQPLIYCICGWKKQWKDHVNGKSDPGPDAERIPRGCGQA